MKRDFSNITRQTSRPKDDNPMDQFFGDSPSTKKEQLAKPSPTIEVESVVKKATEIMDHKKVNKTGFGILLAVLLASAGFFGFNGNWTDTIGAILFVVVTIILMLKVKYRYSEESNYYLANVTTTLRAMFRHYRITKKLMDNAIPIMSWSVVLMTIEHFLLRWFLFSPISSTLYTIGYYVLWIGIIMSFAKRDTKSAHRALMFVYGYYVLSILFTTFFYHDLYYFTVITAILIWILAGWMKNCEITDVKVTTNE